MEILTSNPSFKLLVLHGYHDMATPFHQTELDLKVAGLAKRTPVKVFEGGHMTYYTDKSRAPFKAELDKFYAAPGSAAIN